MRTIKLTIEYDGTNYCGWQIQPTGQSVQGVLCKAVRKMTGEENHVVGASRTDAGVHALGQVAHFRTSTMIPPVGFMRGINSAIDCDIAVTAAEEAPSDFHAQKDAVSKLYRYLILNGDAPSALLANRCWHVRDKLDIDAMKEAAECLAGKHDFKSFQAAGSSARDAVREIDRMGIRGIPPLCKGRLGGVDLPPLTPPYKGGEAYPLVSIDVEGSGFVYHMVRNIVGTLILIGKGKLQARDMEKILKAKERKKAGATAPAKGLYLISVDY